MAKTVLITGGTGAIGSRLTNLLKQQGFAVSILSRSEKEIPGVSVYKWDVENDFIDPKAIASADYIVHLAGEGIADKRWTEERKEEILNSRTKSTALLVKALRSAKHHVQAFVGASAIGYYGADTGDRPLNESSAGGSDFLSQVVRLWERSEDQVAALGIRTVKLRFGLVLMREGGALARLAQPVRLGVGAPIGSGEQYVSWIHLDDLCRMIIQALTDTSWRGVYNAVSPNPLTNKDLTQAIARTLRRPLVMPNIPAFVVKLAFGEMASVVVGGNFVRNKRINEETSFQYSYPRIDGALEDLLG